MQIESRPSYLVQCETARRSTKNFTRILKKLREQYEKLWEENLEITKCLEELGTNTCYHCLNPIVQQKPNNILILEPGVNKENESVNLKVQNSKDYELQDSRNPSNESSIPEIYSMDFESDIEHRTFTEKSSSCEEIPQILKSPIISKRRRKHKQVLSQSKSFSKSASKKTTSLNEIFANMDFEEAMCSVSESVKNQTNGETYTTYLERNNKDEELTRSNQNEDKSKTYKKLGFSTLYNVDTEFLHDGRKLKQSKLILKPANPKMDVSPFSGKEDESYKNSSKDEISPFDTAMSFSEEKLSNAKNVDKNELKNSTFDDCAKESVSLSKLSSNALKPSCSTPRKNGSKNISKSSTSKYYEKLDSDADVIVNDSTFFVLPEYAQQPVITSSGEKDEPKKRKLSEIVDSCPIDDETFFSPGEKQQSKSSKTEPKIMSTQVKQFVQNYDIVPEKKTKSPTHPYKGKTLRNKTERAKLQGWDCWECEKFYEGMDYTEEELRQHKKKCSRHKSKFKERYNTPADFWNPLFSDNLSSSYEDNEF